MFNQMKKGMDLTQANVKDCMERVTGEAKERFGVVGEFEKEMMRLSDNMSKYRVRQRGCSLTHSARTPPAVHPGITIWVDEN